VGGWVSARGPVPRQGPGRGPRGRSWPGSRPLRGRLFLKKFMILCFAIPRFFLQTVAVQTPLPTSLKTLSPSWGWFSFNPPGLGLEPGVWSVKPASTPSPTPPFLRRAKSKSTNKNMIAHDPSACLPTRPGEVEQCRTMDTHISSGFFFRLGWQIGLAQCPPSCTIKAPPTTFPIPAGSLLRQNQTLLCQIIF